MTANAVSIVSQVDSAKPLPDTLDLATTFRDTTRNGVDTNPAMEGTPA